MAEYHCKTCGQEISPTVFEFRGPGNCEDCDRKEAMKRPTLFECQFITLSEFLSEEEYEIVSELITNAFTWGDTEVVLVTPAALRDVLDQRATWDRCEVEEMNAAQKVRDAMEIVGDSVYVNLY